MLFTLHLIIWASFWDASAYAASTHIFASSKYKNACSGGYRSTIFGKMHRRPILTILQNCNGGRSWKWGQRQRVGMEGHYVTEGNKSRMQNQGNWVIELAKILL